MSDSHGCGRKIGPYDCCTVVCGDCLQLMKAIPDGAVDAVITDPPYVGMVGGIELKPSAKAHAPVSIPSFTVGDQWSANLEWFSMAWRACDKALFAFCSYHFVSELGILALNHRVALLTWYKRNAPLPVQNVPHLDCEFIWALRKNPGANWKNLSSCLLDVAKLSTGTCASPERVVDGQRRALHPTQKPESIIAALILPGLETILDPFLGSGTTAVAAKKLGRHFLGFEISPEYCKIAEGRIALVEMQLNLLAPESAPQTGELFGS